MEKRKVVVIGGGTGSSSVLNGLKTFPDLDLKVIVNMTDDGGSNRVIRDEFGLLPLSDIRKSIIALADNDKNELLRTIFTHRFSGKNGLSGHTLGNLFMMALSEKYGGEVNAVKELSRLLEIKGEVLPITTESVRLCATYSSGETVIGEHFIDESENIDNQKIEKLYLSPSAKAYGPAVDAILAADYVIIGPGDFYTTTLANLIIEGISDAIQRTSAKIIFITNLMTKKGETRWMKQKDFITELEKYVKRIPEIVLVNDGAFPKDIVKKYRQTGEHLLQNNFTENDELLVVQADLLNRDKIIIDKGDTLPRSYIRHDPSKLGYILYGIIMDFEI
jgi:uncharacterized cofD-like protein